MWDQLPAKTSSGTVNHNTAERTMAISHVGETPEALPPCWESITTTSIWANWKHLPLDPTRLLHVYKVYWHGEKDTSFSLRILWEWLLYWALGKSMFSWSIPHWTLVGPDRLCSWSSCPTATKAATAWRLSQAPAPCTLPIIAACQCQLLPPLSLALALRRKWWRSGHRLLILYGLLFWDL